MFENIYEEKILHRLFQGNSIAKLSQREFANQFCQTDTEFEFPNNRSSIGHNKIVLDTSENGNLQWVFSPIHIRHVFNEYLDLYFKKEFSSKSWGWGFSQLYLLKLCTVLTKT